MINALECDMMEWVMNRPEVAPAFTLARAGYDVWAGNNRGNRFANTHIKLDPKSKEFWDFSWEEMGTHDIPAMAEYIKSTTGNAKISYIGHSQGATQFLAGASLKPQYYKDTFAVANLLAPPAALVYNSNSGLHFMAKKFNRALIKKTLDTIGMYNLVPYNYIQSGAAGLFCDLFNGKICDALVSMASDLDPTVDDTERYEMALSNLPSGAGYKNFFHYGQ